MLNSPKDVQATPLRLEVGKTYKSVAGRKFRVLGERVTSGATLASFITLYMTQEGSEIPAYHFSDGMSPASAVDRLVSEYKEPDYRWFNVYKTFNTPLYPSYQRAKDGYIPPSRDYVGTYRIDLNTGEIAREGGEDLRSVKKEED